jgi:DNA replication protein DnaC
LSASSASANRRSTLLRQIAKADLLIIDDFGLPHRISEG